MSAPASLWSLARRSPDVTLAAAALCVVTVLVAPLPPWLLDLCIAANLALSATIFMVALFARETLRLASFPSLLLFTTLLRLALEISSTRLVLARGEAGRIIQAFGQVVVAGNYVVGAVVFAILTLVQLLVVTKGAERVAEVAARFTLDALPGKQMSIDADLRAGAIDQAEARRRRRALERAGQLHGAMDGALKFVKGDAVAGVAIVVVNVAGGLVAGVMRGMPVELAARRYALLAIGDGLVAQIPALLVSVAAGVAVTRVEGDEHGGSLAEELRVQLFTDARVLAAVAGLCAALALLPGMPLAPFVALALLCGSGAWLRIRRSRASPGQPVAVEAPVLRSAGPARLVLEIADDLSADAAGRSLAHDVVPAIERDLAGALGFPVPALSIRVAPLSAGAWRLLLDGVPAAAGRAPPTEAVALLAPVELEPLGIAAAPELEPLTGAIVSRVAAGDVARVRALCPVREPLDRVAAALSATIRRDAQHLLGIQQVQDLLDGLEASHPALVRETLRQVPVPIAAEVLRQLLEEGIALRPLHAIFEAMLDGGAGARAPAVLAEFCRRTLRRQIAHRHAGDGALEALLLDPATEAALRASLSGEAFAVDPRAARTLLDDLERQLEARRGGGAPPVLLASAELRRGVRQLVAARFPRVAVLSYEELPPTLAVRPVGRIALGES